VQVHANANSPIGSRTAPIQHNGRRASGGVGRFWDLARRVARLYHLFPRGVRAFPRMRPSPIPRKARPATPST